MEIVSLEKKYPCRNEGECIWRVVDSEGVILPEEGQWLHELNDIGLEIWKMCDGTLSLEKITDKICDEFDVEKEVAEADIQS